MPPSLAGLIAKRFIARPDVHARQGKNGAWRPVEAPFTKELIDQHLAGEITVGHYVVNQNQQSKLFCLDVDLRDHTKDWVGWWIEHPSGKDFDSLMERFPEPGPEQDAAWMALTNIYGADSPRELWADKTHPSRPYWLDQMKTLSEMLAQRIWKECEIPVTVEYSGSKGFHVNGHTGLINAADARLLGVTVLESFERFALHKGKNFWVDTTEDRHESFANFEIEVFPKQDTVDEGHFGNLIALPLGRNLKAPQSKKFFFDQREGRIKPHPDPLALLTGGNPWS